jgi:repressor LexA
MAQTSSRTAGRATGRTEPQLTPRQRRILEFISATVRERGYPPTVREIGEAVGLTSSSSVHAQISNLERRGLLHKDPTKPRAMTLSEPRVEGVVVPLVGRIAAGAPVMAAENVEEYLTVPMGFASDAEHFALRVRGDSMTGAGILDGDVVVVRSGEAADDGDVVAALLPGPAEDEATIKRLKRSRNRVMLHPENPALEPFEMDPEGRILGTVVAVLRKL